MAKPVDHQCRAFKVAIEVLGRPWTAYILSSLQGGPRRFTEIAASTPGLSDKVLSARLKDLEARVLVARHVDPGPPVRVSYELTKKGHAFEEVARAIELWGRELVGGDAPRRRRAG